MAMYEPIKGCEDKEDKRNKPVMRKTNDDVELGFYSNADADHDGHVKTIEEKKSLILPENAKQYQHQLQHQKQQQQQQQNQRLVSLDVFRGLTVAVNIYVSFFFCLYYFQTTASKVYRYLVIVHPLCILFCLLCFFSHDLH